MKYFAAIALTLALPAFCAPALAESPEQLTMKIIQEIQKKQSLTAAADSVDWDGALAAMDPKMRKEMNLKSGEDLKNHQVEQYSGMGDKALEGLNKAANSAPADRQALLKTMQEHAQNSIDSQKAAAKKDLIETMYSVGKTTVDGDRAKVELIKKKGERVTTTYVEFVKAGTGWKLKSAAPFSPNDGSQPGSSSLMGPPVVMPGEGMARM